MKSLINFTCIILLGFVILSCAHNNNKTFASHLNSLPEREFFSVDVDIQKETSLKSTDLNEYLKKIKLDNTIVDSSTHMTNYESRQSVLSHHKTIQAILVYCKSNGIELIKYDKEFYNLATRSSFGFQEEKYLLVKDGEVVSAIYMTYILTVYADTKALSAISNGYKRERDAKARAGETANCYLSEYSDKDKYMKLQFSPWSDNEYRASLFIKNESKSIIEFDMNKSYLISSDGKHVKFHYDPKILYVSPGTKAAVPFVLKIPVTGEVSDYRFGFDNFLFTLKKCSRQDVDNNKCRCD